MIKVQDKYWDPKCKCTFWYLFLDTNSTIADFFPSRDKVSSARQTELAALPPWSYVGFDLMVDPTATAQTPKEALSFNYLKAYGRPVCLTFSAVFSFL